MSILSSTHSGWKYHYIKDIVKNSCVMLLNGKEIDLEGELTDDKRLIIKPSGIITFKLFTRTLSRGSAPDNWFTDMPIKMFPFIKPAENYRFIIKKDFEKVFEFAEIWCDVFIDYNITNFAPFRQCKIHGDVGCSCLEIKDLFCNGISPYFGKDIMGF